MVVFSSYDTMIISQKGKSRQEGSCREKGGTLVKSKNQGRKGGGRFGCLSKVLRIGGKPLAGAGKVE
jgi:hypothetical protein